ncbi:MAG: hypothetical protein RLN80_01675, partial [Rhodospirillales bacterium]
MMVTFRRPKRNEEADLRAAFVAEDACGELLQQGQPSGIPAASTARLYQQLLSGQLDWARLSPGARRTATELERGLSVVDFGTAIAAADSGPLSRHQPGCSVTFRPSQSNPGLTYMLVSGAALTESN